MSTSTLASKPFGSDILLKEELSDLTVYIGQNKQNACKFPAHQFILRSASSVFYSMLDGIGNTRELLLSDVTPQSFYTLLCYLYKGELQLTTISEILENLRMADKYKIKNLKEECFEQMKVQEVNYNNFWDLFCCYDLYGEEFTPWEVKLKMFVCFDENASRILKNHKFLFLKQETVFKIVSRDTSNIPEIELCNAIVEWSKMQCFVNRLNLTHSNQRELLGNILYHIRLLAIRQDFKSNPLYKLLNRQEKAQIMEDPSTLPAPWNFDLLKKSRQQYFIKKWEKKNAIKYEYNDVSYIVFGKDTFLHSVWIWAENSISKFKTRALANGGENQISSCSLKPQQYCNSCMYLQQHPTKYQPQPYPIHYHVEMNGLFFKANTVYSLETEPPTQLYYHSSNCEKEFQVVVDGLDVKNFTKFLSPNYMQEYFANNKQDDNVIERNNKSKSIFWYVKATFA